MGKLELISSVFVTFGILIRKTGKPEQTMIRTILTLVAVLFVFSMFGQSNTCNCAENLARTIQKTEENYAGYPAKVNALTQQTYRQLVRSLQVKAAAETNTKACYYLLRQYVRFFKDKHFIITYNNPRDFDSTVRALSSAALPVKSTGSFEGVWTNPEKTTRIQIRKTKDGGYEAIKLEGSTDAFPKGFVYFTLHSKGSRWYVKEYNAFISTDVPVKLKGNLLFLWNHAAWGRVSPAKMSDTEEAELATWLNNNNGLAFRKLEKDIAYLRIPTFFNNDANIQNLVASADSTIRNTKYLIVDLTGNGGGNSGWISFLPYFMTNPMVQAPSFVRVTKDNIPLKLADIEPFVSNPIPDEYKKYFPDSTLAVYKKAYQELPVTRQSFYPVPGVNFPLDSLMRKPEKIALVVDDLCGSSSEYFIFLSRQSKKTITYGVNTVGMMDYEGMSTPTPLPYDGFLLVIPIVKSSWTDKNPIDQTGFKPDVILKQPQTEWLKIISKDLPQRAPVRNK